MLQTIYGESKGIGSFSNIDLLYKSVLGLPEFVHLDLSYMLMISLDIVTQSDLKFKSLVRKKIAKNKYFGPKRANILVSRMLRPFSRM